MGDAVMRRGDTDKLLKLCKDFDRHEAREKQWMAEQSDRLDALVTASQNNTKTIAELSTQVGKLVEDTRDVVQLHKDFQATARIGHKMQDLLVFVGKWGAIGAGITGCVHWLLTHLKGP